MKGSFNKRGRHCDITVTKAELCCTLKTNLGPNVVLNINLSDILASQTQPRDSSDVNSIVIHYASAKKDSSLSWAKLVLSGEPELCKELNSVFTTALPDRLRPKHYLVVINPMSGKKRAGLIFHKKVAPLFKACGITFRLFEASTPTDLEAALRDVNFSDFEGAIAVGGDGHFATMITGLVRKQQQMAGVNIDDMEENLQPLPFPVGIIPGGSGNFLADYLHGSKDAVTAAIKIVLGDTTPINVSGVYQGEKLSGFGCLITSFGLLGEMMNACERNRWMGNARYKVLPVRCIFARRPVDMELKLQRERTGEWFSINGSFYNADIGVVDLVNKDTKLVPRFGDSAFSLHLTSACPLGLHIKQLSKVAAWDAGAYDFDFVRTERVTGYQASLTTCTTRTAADGETVLEKDLYMNVDGEPLRIYKPTFHVRLHKGIVNLFGTHS